jgi:GTPase SAR1 family protein
LGVEAGVKVFNYPNDEYGLIQIWDTAGRHHNHEEICERYYNNTDGFLIVIDKKDENTLKSIGYWHDSTYPYM